MLTVALSLPRFDKESRFRFFTRPLPSDQDHFNSSRVIKCRTNGTVRPPRQPRTCSLLLFYPHCCYLHFARPFFLVVCCENTHSTNVVAASVE
jgi:hypothetical protein